jgi:NAD(P)-dependent dehydrogenase (short-subunit alcohol dehydrogenase family)
MNKCTYAQRKLQKLFPARNDSVFAIQLELNDLESVLSFVTHFKSRFSRLDYLVNNAGSILPKGSRTKQGLEESLGTMHIGHFALTRWLLDLMSKPLPGIDNTVDSARVINVASEGFLAGNFHPSIFLQTGEGDFNGEFTDNCEWKLGSLFPCCPSGSCPYTNGYARAKLANVLHIQELQRRYDRFLSNIPQQLDVNEKVSNSFRRIVTASLHPGGVASNVASIMQYVRPLLRSPDEAAWIVMHAILDNSFIPSAFIDSMKGSHDLDNYKRHELSTHLINFPAMEGNPEFIYLRPDNGIRNFSLHSFAWGNTQFIKPMIPDLQEKSNQEIAHLLKIRLWDSSENIINNWLQKKNSSLIFGNEIKETEFTLHPYGLGKRKPTKIDSTDQERWDNDNLKEKRGAVQYFDSAEPGMKSEIKEQQSATQPSPTTEVNVVPEKPDSVEVLNSDPHQTEVQKENNSVPVGNDMKGDLKDEQLEIQDEYQVREIITIPDKSDAVERLGDDSSLNTDLETLKERNLSSVSGGNVDGQNEEL